MNNLYENQQTEEIINNLDRNINHNIINVRKFVNNLLHIKFRNENSKENKDNQNQQITLKLSKIKNIYNYRDISEYNKWKGSPLENILNKNKDKVINWNYKLLIKNKNISLNYVEEKIDKFYSSIDMIVYNHNITMKFFYNYLNNECKENKSGNLIDNKYIISSNINLEKNNYELYNEIYFDLNKNLNLFNKDGLSSNPTIQPEIIINNFDKLNVYNLLYNKEILIDDFDFIYNVFKGDMVIISYNHNITPEMIKKNNNLDWKYSLLHNSLCITEEFIEETIDKDWNWKGLSKNKNMSFKFILKHKDKYLNWSLLSKRVTFEDVISNLTIIWDWTNLTINPNIEMEDIMNNPDLPWNLYNIAENPNFNEVAFYRYLDYINFEQLASNEFSYNHIVYEKNVKKDIKQNQIRIKNSLSKYLYNDLIHGLLTFVYYN